MRAYEIAAGLVSAMDRGAPATGAVWGTVSAVSGATASVTPDGDDAPTGGVSVLSSARGLKAGDRVLLDRHSGEMFVVAYVCDAARIGG